MAVDLKEYVSDEIDALQEIGNIGSAHAATALSVMLNRRVEMGVPVVKLVPFTDIVNITGSPEDLCVGAFVDLTGDLTGYILFVLGEARARKMTRLLFHSDEKSETAPGNPLELSELERSAFGEVTNIMAGAYLTAIEQLAGFVVKPSTPSVGLDMVGAMLSIIAVDYASVSDSILYLQAQFMEDTELDGNVFLILDMDSYDKLMKSLGVLK